MIIVFTFAIIFTFTSLHLHLYISIFTTPDIPEVYYSDGLLHGYGSPVICGGTQVYLKIWADLSQIGQFTLAWQ